MERAMAQVKALPRHWVKAWAGTLGAALCIVLSLPGFFRYIEGKPGIGMPDPFLDRLPAVDISVPLFVILYAVVATAVVALARHPLVFLRAAQAYVLLLLLRMVTMALVTLEPPPGLVELEDPISTLFYPEQRPFDKDLFFSGHTATVFLLYLAFPKGLGRLLLLLATALVGMAVLVQHVHWTVDVLAAPFFAWMAWWSAGHTTGWSLGVPFRIGAE